MRAGEAVPPTAHPPACPRTSLPTILPTRPPTQVSTSLGISHHFLTLRPHPAGSFDQFDAAQLNSIIANQKQANSKSKDNTNAVVAKQTNVAGKATNKGEPCPALP